LSCTAVLCDKNAEKPIYPTGRFNLVGTFCAGFRATYRGWLAIAGEAGLQSYFSLHIRCLTAEFKVKIRLSDGKKYPGQ
jgi:hypothetical protein